MLLQRGADQTAAQEAAARPRSQERAAEHDAQLVHGQGWAAKISLRKLGSH